MTEEKQYPSLFEQGKNLAAFSFEVVKNAMTGGALFVSDKIKNERMEICKSCEFYDEKENKCIECGCLLEYKTQFALDSCPKQKWSISSEDWMSGGYEKLLKDIDKGCCNQETLDNDQKSE